MTQVTVVPEVTVMLAGWKFRLSWWSPTPAGITMVLGTELVAEDAVELDWTVETEVGRLGGLSRTYVITTGMTMAITPIIIKSLFPEGVSFGYDVSILAYHRER